VLLVVALLGTLAGCASKAADQSPSETPAVTQSPEAGPADPPSSPGPETPEPGQTSPIATDETPAGVIVGTVTADSSGPCYLIETDDGRPYALVGEGGTVQRGQRIRAQTDQQPTTADCGPGRQVHLVKLDVSS
jgi:hypothetical protein